MSEDLRTGRLIPYLTEMFRFQAWMAMGKVASPVSGKVERDLRTARAMIDLLAELETRTEGHRSPEESKILQGALTELRLNFLDEQKKPAEPEGEEAPKPSPDDAVGDETVSKESESE